MKPKQTCRRRARGFTLIEIAVVLVIVGLLLGSVMTGRTLIEAAEYRALRGEVESYQAAWHAFRERYRALPGDFAHADRRLGLTGVNGNGNGVVDGGVRCENAASENCMAWQHLRAADLLTGDPDLTGATASPNHPYGGPVSGFFSGSQGNGEFGHKLLLEAIPGDVAARLDNDLDDGRADRGRVSCLRGCQDGNWPESGLVDVVVVL